MNDFLPPDWLIDELEKQKKRNNDSGDALYLPLPDELETLPPPTKQEERNPIIIIPI